MTELLNKIAGCGITFHDLPDKMQHIALLNSLKGIQVVGSRKQKNLEDWKLFIQQEALKISSINASPFQISTYGIGWEKSNLDAEDVPLFLKIFHIDGAWRAIQEITSAIGCTIPSPKDFFQNAALRRHSAAHDPTTGSLYTDLADFTSTVRSFAASIDFLLSFATRLITTGDNDYLNNKRKVVYTDLSFRYIQRHGSLFKEMSQTNTISIANFHNLSDAVASLKSRTNFANESIVVIDYPSKVYSWFTNL